MVGVIAWEACSALGSITGSALVSISLGSLVVLPTCFPSSAALLTPFLVVPLLACFFPSTVSLCVLGWFARFLGLLVLFRSFAVRALHCLAFFSIIIAFASATFSDCAARLPPLFSIACALGFPDYVACSLPSFASFALTCVACVSDLSLWLPPSERR